jgi:hypothetical protein
VFRFLLRIFRESFYLHLLLPLAVSVVVGSLVARATGSITGFGVEQLIDYWVFKKIFELLAVYVTFIVVMVRLIQRDTRTRIANLGALEETLTQGKSFFALAPISLSEWYEPSVQVYLTRLFAQQSKLPQFQHERVLVFFTESSLEDAHASFLDGYYARCLIRQHQAFGASLGFIGPKDIRALLSQLSVSNRRALGCYPLLVAWLPGLFLTHINPAWLRRRIRELAFAVVTDSDGRLSVIRFQKGRRILTVSPVKETELQPFLEFTKLVKERVYYQGTTNLSRAHDFAEQLAI